MKETVMDRVFTKDEWGSALMGLKDSYRVYVPVKEGDFHVYRPLEKGTDPDFTFQNTRLSPKSLIQPQSEGMFEFSLEEKGDKANVVRERPREFQAQAIVGIRPCDAHAFQLVKVNFDTPEFRDPWWLKRFESTTFVGLGCNEPCSTCFCSSTGTGPFSQSGLDVIVYDMGEVFLLRSLTEKGEAIVQKIKGGQAPDPALIDDAERLAASAVEKISSTMHTDRLREKEVNDLFEAPFWEEVAFACINCGTCTYLCPTCWCFDIQDEVYRQEGDRIRNWDSCMFPLFTYHASGHNPRSKKVQRVRQRFMHKLKYYVDKYEDGVACVGCGRCVQFCPVNIDIRRVCEHMNNYG